MPARHKKRTRRTLSVLAATGRFLAVALLAFAAASVIAVGDTDVQRVSSAFNAITTFDMH
jgi:hypothetical protein